MADEAARPPGADYEVAKQELAVRELDVRAGMRDGVELAGTLFLPDGAGPFPTLVRKTPYGRGRNSHDDRFYAGQGYAVLVMSQRGRFGSGGAFYQARNEGWFEHPDGYDTIEWAAAQPWSSGAVGTFGISSDGQWQVTTAPTRPPHLRAMLISYPAYHRVGRLERGIHTSSGPTWHANNDALARPLNTVEAWQAWLGDWRDSGLPLLASFIHPELVDQYLHTAYDDFSREMDPGRRYADFDVPILQECGWYDRYIRPTFQNFIGVRTLGRSQATRRAQQVIVGPWLHGGIQPRESGTAQLGPAAEPRRREFHLRWFDHWLKGIDNGAEQDPPVRLYLMGADRWLAANDWPLADTHPWTLYLRSGRPAVGESLNGGRLSSEATVESEAPDEYEHDPYDPIPSIGHHGGFGRMWAGGPRDNRPAEARSLTYTTEPLERDLEVVGESSLRFFASSSAVDTDFIATLTDVYPDGFSAVLRPNAVRGLYRRGEAPDDLLPLTPGRVEELELVSGLPAQSGHTRAGPPGDPRSGRAERHLSRRTASVGFNVADPEHLTDRSGQRDVAGVLQDVESALGAIQGVD